MDRQEYREIISEIKNSYKKKDYERVIMFARELPVKKIKENNVLEMLATAYDQTGKTSLARTTLEIAYRRMPNGKQTAYKMAVLCLKLDDIESAVQYYEEFCKIAPNDNQKYILKYEIATAGGLSLYDRIRILEDYTAKETDDRWMYELARLYHEAGMADKCVEMCDDIVVWFSDGDYLKKALELKFQHKALSPTQQAMYERIMQEYIEDYEEPEPEPEETYEEYEEDAEQFANDFLGEDAAKDPMKGDTKPINLPPLEDEAVEEEQPAEEDEEIPEEEAPEEKPNINLTTTKGEPADELAAEVASSIAKNGVAEPRQGRKNIFYDFKLELSQPLTPVRKPEIKTSAPIAEEPVAEEVAAAETVVEETAKEAPSEELLPEETPVMPEPVKDVFYTENVSEEAEKISERLFAEDEKLPELVPEPEQMAYIPEQEELILTPALDAQYERKQLKVNEGQVGINLDLLANEEEEVEGQLSIDQLFQTYANNIENNIENKAAVARVEAERLKQIREAVESSRPAVVIDDFDDYPAASEEAPSRAKKVVVEEDTVTFSRELTAGEGITASSPDLKDTVIFSKDDLLEEQGELKIPEAFAEKEEAELAPESGFRIEDEPELAYEDPVDKLFREFEEQERAKEAARQAEIRAMEAAVTETKKKEIEIPAFLRDVHFTEPEEDDLEEDLELLEEAAEENAEELTEETAEDVSEEEIEETADDFAQEEDALFEELVDEFAQEEEEVSEEPADEYADEPEPEKTIITRPERTEEDLFDEIMVEVEEEVKAAKPVKTAEEIEAELDDLGDFLADSLSFEPEEEPQEEAEPEMPAEGEVPVKKLELTEEQEMELDDLGDALADIFGDDAEPSEETAEAVEEVTEEAAEVAEDAAEVTEKVEEEAAEEVTEEAEEVAEDVTEVAEDVTEEVAEDAAEVAEEVTEEVTEEAAEDVTEEAEEVAEEAEGVTEEAAEIAEDVTEEAAEVAEAVAEEAEEVAEAVAEEAEEVAEDVTEEATEVTEEVTEAAEEATEVTEEVTEEAAEVVEEATEQIAEETEEVVEAETEELAEETDVAAEAEPLEESELEALIEEAEGVAEEDAEETAEADDEPEPEYEVINEALLGDTQPIERIHNFVMPWEMKEELAEFLLIQGMDEKITKTINDIILTRRSGDPTGGHLIITGDKKIGKTFLTISIIKAINNELNSGSGKVAKVQSDSLNGKDVAKVFRKIAGNDLIIENVGDLEEQTIRDILDVMTDGSVQNMVVFEGNMLALETIINNHPEVKTLFKNRLDVSELTISQWADVACDYAKRKGYHVGDMALLALHAKIDEINVPTTRFGYEDIVNIMETAIEKCEKRNTGKLFSAFSRKEGEEIELNESDFI